MPKIAFMGSKALGRAILARLVDQTRPPHRVVGALCPADTADARSELAGFQDDARRCAVPLCIAATAWQAEEALHGWAPDVVLVAGWYQIIRLERFPATRFFGFHFSPLPRYRGNAPLVWQILRGEPETGVSFFQFAPGMDEGDLVAQATYPLGEDATITDALLRSEQAAVEMLTTHLRGLMEGTVVLRPQEPTGATYCGLRVPEDGRIDWTWPARRVHDFIRAQTRPYPGAFTILPGERSVRIWRSAVEPRPYFGVAGGVAERSVQAVVVTCGEGAVRVLEAQVDGAEPAPVGTIFDSLRIRL